LAIEINGNPDLIYCPNIECQLAVSKKAYSCVKCKTQICSKCHLKDHPGSKCAKVDEAGLRVWAMTNNGVKNCPGCQSRTEKSSGCNHMSCQRCSHQWCWICGQTCDEFHYDYLSVKGIIYGCPGLQFVNLNKVLLLFLVFLAWTSCIQLIIYVPLIVAIVGTFIAPGMLLAERKIKLPE